MDERKKEILAVINGIKSARTEIGWILFKANNVDATLCEIRKRFKNLLGDDDLTENAVPEPIRMEEDFVFGYRINEDTKRETVLEKKDISLLMNGLNYALTKDFTSKRKSDYRELMKKLNVVINGGNYRGRSRL